MTDITERLRLAIADRYVIERHVGEGGMAAVYLAHDVRHDRKVALKVLRPELAAVIGAERFLAEIKTTANLQHPNILPLFDSGDADGQLFYVMPYVEGETLRERLEHERQLPVEEAVKMGTEVADALDYAHRHGIVHRDIKPENILLHEGRALVADFGIALALSTAGGSRMTETGMSVGTPAYMSPEQAMGGHDVTARSDVYALGATLYEALVGEPPFTGPTAQAIIARLVTEEPRPLTTQRKTIPLHVEAAVLKALERLPADRFATAAELGEALEGRLIVSARPGATADPVGVAIRPRRRALSAVVGAVIVALAGLAAWGWSRPVAAPTTRHQVVLGSLMAGAPRALGWGTAIAPDGSALVYVDSASRRVRLLLKERDRVSPRLLATLSSRGPGPSFSPDGQSVAFDDGKLQRVSRGGGAPVVLSDAAVCCGTAWLDNDTIVSIDSGQQRLYAIPAAGGPARTILTVDSASSLFQRVSPVPGRDAVLVGVTGPHPEVIALDLATGEKRQVRANALAAWVVGDILMYVEAGGDLYAMRFDSRRLEATGTAVNVLDSVRSLQQIPDLTVGSDGTVLYVRGAAVQAIRPEITRVARDGSVAVLDSALPMPVVVSGGGVDLSPDGRLLAVSLNDSTARRSDIYVFDLRGGVPTRLTFDGTTNIRPQWSPDGTRILYVSDRGSGGTVQMWAKRADGSGTASLVASDPRQAWGGLWSPDGKWVVYRTDDVREGNGDIVALRTAGDTVRVPLVATSAIELSPALSPDGRWLAYSSNVNGPQEVFVRPFPDTSGARWQVSAGAGSEPRWSHDGSKLFYWGGGGRFVEASVQTSPTFAVEARTELFGNLGFVTNAYYHFYGVAPDDRHFIMLRDRPERVTGSDQLIEIDNWLPELRAKLKR